MKERKRIEGTTRKLLHVPSVGCFQKFLQLLYKYSVFVWMIIILISVFRKYISAASGILKGEILWSEESLKTVLNKIVVNEINLKRDMGFQNALYLID